MKLQLRTSLWRWQPTIAGDKHVSLAASVIAARNFAACPPVVRERHASCKQVHPQACSVPNSKGRTNPFSPPFPPPFRQRRTRIKRRSSKPTTESGSYWQPEAVAGDQVFRARATVIFLRWMFVKNTITSSGGGGSLVTTLAHGSSRREMGNCTILIL